MVKKQLVSAGIILALITSNVIIGNQYISDSKAYESKIRNKNKLIEQYEVNSIKNEQIIKKLDFNIKDLHQQLDTYKGKLYQLKKVNKKQQQELKRYKKVKQFVVTAYTANQESTGKTSSDKAYGITASGTKVKEGVTVACSPSYPFGTKLRIQNIGIRVCEDHGSAIKGNHLDLYIASLSKAIEFGRQSLLVEVLN